jgi:hypothetical protein
MAEAVYILCTVTSLVCAWLLYRGYRSSRFRLLFWSSLCFLAFALANAFLFCDLIIWPDVDLTMARTVLTLLGLGLLLYGLIFESN